MLVSETGAKIGEVPIQDARRIAETEGLDLVQVSKNGAYPVVRMMNYGKMLYDQKKQSRGHSAKKPETKIVRFSQSIGDNDLGTKTRQIKSFLSKGHTVRCVVRRRGRERQSTERAEDLLGKLEGMLKGEGKASGGVKSGAQDRHSLEIVFSPIKK